ncbi:RluA family pseudouridine synthase [Clostridium sp. SHJSY1]|uniref:RluA family pseudouridine synthase n=1 Tax=Clostridium sp. SHJSY1 TaxID=2942483 RepID=UPI0028741610|nr:RluA family pseudouridine synthase [Clostridium sp. SHJSY1]MDS0528387.1 RluA family pseudouridine synthase [Clostridium sp. SHJSY1]
MSTLEKKVDSRFEGATIREFLKEELGLSSRLIKGAAVENRILVNKNSVRMRYILHEGDEVLVKLQRKESQNIIPEDIEIKIVYEDEDILVLNKQPNIVVHPTRMHPTGTLANGILYYFQKTKQNCIVRLVSRLDMDTSGLIIIAKNQFAHMALSKEMQENNLEKRYLAVVHGNLKEKEGTIDAPIYRQEGSEDIQRIIDERGQRSITHYKVLESFNGGDLVECLLETGRTHQIRVHLNHLGHPIYGDSLYGYGEEEKDLIGRQGLHAYGLDFKSPRTKEILSLRADLPNDMKELLEKIK